MKFINTFVLVSLLLISFASAQVKAPEKLQAALFMKVLSFNKGLTGDVTIHVAKSPAFAAEIKKYIGKKLGTGTLAAVTVGDGAPTGTAQVVYIGDASAVAAATAYTKSKKALSISGVPGLLTSGVTLGVFVEGNKPQIHLSLTNSKAEDINWNPTILKVVISK